MYSTPKFSPMARNAGIAAPFWDEALRAGINGLIVEAHGPAATLRIDDRDLTNMSSFSYLGLDENPAIIEGAIRQLTQSNVIKGNSSLSLARMRPKVLDETEERLSTLFGADVGIAGSCATAAWAMLPLLASGLLSGGVRPVMVFDRYAHFCLQSIRALCALEAEVTTIGHNDMDKLETLCQEKQLVAYVGDSVYSTGGTVAPMQALMDLQDRYGMYLFLDEAHGTSVIGEKGEGYALDVMGEMNDRTILVTSLDKGFGATGGAIMFAPRGDQLRRQLAYRSGGPFMWSQRVNAAGFGAIDASCDIHESPELARLQIELRRAIDTFDRCLPLPDANPESPVRFVPIGDETETIRTSRALMDSGYYVESDFFPVVMWGEAGLRVRLRATMTDSVIRRFCALLSEHLEGRGIRMTSPQSD
jgi:7-keto-8-aminopelargonate synthetase-like enzyme